MATVAGFEGSTEAGTDIGKRVQSYDCQPVLTAGRELQACILGLLSGTFRAPSAYGDWLPQRVI